MFTAKVITQITHNVKYRFPLMQDLIHESIHAFKKVVSDVLISEDEVEDILITIQLTNKGRGTTIISQNCSAIALALEYVNFNSVSKSLLSRYIDEIFLGILTRAQGINADRIWLTVDEDVVLQVSPSKVGKQLIKMKNIEKIILFSGKNTTWIKAK